MRARTSGRTLPSSAWMHTRPCCDATFRLLDCIASGTRSLQFVSSTFRKGGFSPRQQCLGLFSLGRAGPSRRRIMRRPQRPAAPRMREAPTQDLACPGTSPPRENALKTHDPTQDSMLAPKPPPLRGRPELSAYLQKILNARVYDVAVETALDPARSLSRRLGNHVLLKREDQQSVFSFKLRGAYNKMAHLPPEQLARGVICASAGNHAQGVALSARRLGCKAVIVMPRDHAAAEGGRRACPGRRGGAAWRQLLRRLRARARTRKGPGPELRAPLRRPGRDRRPGHDRDGDPAPAPGARSTRCSWPSAAAG